MLLLALFSCLLLSAAQPAQAAKKTKAAAKSGDYAEIPAINWSLASSGFIELFKLRNREIESAEPGRFFPGAVAFALGRIDESGHYLKLSCGSAGECGAKRDTLEDRLMYATLLEVIQTPKAKKYMLYDERTWALTGLGEQYIEKLRKRYPDLSIRLARLVGASFAQ
jgi:hypothetical protein